MVFDLIQGALNLLSEDKLKIPIHCFNYNNDATNL